MNAEKNIQQEKRRKAVLAAVPIGQSQAASTREVRDRVQRGPSGFDLSIRAVQNFLYDAEGSEVFIAPVAGRDTGYHWFREEEGK